MIQYFLHLFILCELYLMLALGFQIVMGWSGLFNLSHIGLSSIGAYCVALLTTDYGFTFWQAIFLAPVVTTLITLPLGLMSFRLKDDYFAIGSLAFALVVQSIIINWRSVTHGVLGVPGIARPIIFDMEAIDNETFSVVVFGFCLVFVLISVAIKYSPMGKFFIAQSEFPECAESLGIQIGKNRMIAFFLSGVYASIAGGLLSSYMSYIDPSSFALSEMIFVISILVLSGMQKVLFVVLATAFLVLLPESLRFVQIDSGAVGFYRQLIYAVILCVVIYLRRKTIFIAKRSV